MVSKTSAFGAPNSTLDVATPDRTPLLERLGLPDVDKNSGLTLHMASERIQRRIEQGVMTVSSDLPSVRFDAGIGIL